MSVYFYHLIIMLNQKVNIENFINWNQLNVMKNLHLPVILILLSVTVSFATLQVEEVTECDSINNELTSKFRFLGGWDSNGIPEYLQPEPDEVQQALINFVKETLPERVNIS